MAKGGGASNVVVGGIITVFVIAIVLGMIAIFSAQMAASTSDATADSVFGNVTAEVSTFASSWIPLIMLGIGLLASIVFISMAIIYLRGANGGMGA